MQVLWGEHVLPNNLEWDLKGRLHGTWMVCVMHRSTFPMCLQLRSAQSLPTGLDCSRNYWDLVVPVHIHPVLSILMLCSDQLQCVGSAAEFSSDILTAMVWMCRLQLFIPSYIPVVIRKEAKKQNAGWGKALDILSYESGLSAVGTRKIYWPSPYSPHCHTLRYHVQTCNQDSCSKGCVLCAKKPEDSEMWSWIIDCLHDCEEPHVLQSQDRNPWRLGWKCKQATNHVWWYSASQVPSTVWRRVPQNHGLLLV